MPDPTERFGFNTLGPGDSISDDGYKIFDQDVRLIDRILQYGLEEHRHTGVAADEVDPDTGPILTLGSGGAIPAGLRVYYRYTLVDDFGFESAASPVSYIDTAEEVSSPSAPILGTVSAGGSLEPGNYSYVLTAYKDATTLETKAADVATIRIPQGTTTNVVTIDLPSLPTGADGFNIYRKDPSSSRFYYLASTSVDYEDDGTVDPTVTRGLPAENTTNGDNMIEVTVPDPVGSYTWMIYRTFDPGNWGSSWLVHLEADGATPTVADSYEDVGESTRSGYPPRVSEMLNSPDPVNLDNVQEVTGYLPPGRNVIPFVVTLRNNDMPEDDQRGPETWTCEFDNCEIMSCRAYYGADQSPDTESIIDVVVWREGVATPTWESIYDDNLALMPSVAAGQMVGDAVPPEITRIYQGETLSFEVEEDGLGPTPVASHLAVNILMLVSYGETDVSHEWAEV